MLNSARGPSTSTHPQTKKTSQVARPQQLFSCCMGRGRSCPSSNAPTPISVPQPQHRLFQPLPAGRERKSADAKRSQARQVPTHKPERRLAQDPRHRHRPRKKTQTVDIQSISASSWGGAGWCGRTSSCGSSWRGGAAVRSTCGRTTRARTFHERERQRGRGEGGDGE